MVLAANNPWRAWIGMKTIQVATADGQITPLYEFTRSGGKGQVVRKVKPASSSDPPPTDWMAPGFDDSMWCRTAGSFGIEAWQVSFGADRLGVGNPGEVAMICLRGKFIVSDPRRVTRLRLSVAYAGGLAVWLNGRQLTAAHLPAGRIEFGTLADTYPDAAYTGPDGKLLSEQDRDELAARYGARIRRLADVEIPAEELIRGVNVLAVAAFRAPLNEIYLTAGLDPASRHKNSTPWPHAKIEDIRLSAAPDDPVHAATRRPRGVQLWNRMILEPTDPTDFGDPSDGLAPIRMTAARNGMASGQVVVSSDEPIAHLSVRAGPLNRQGGSEAIPASAVQVRFALPDGPSMRFDSLVESPPDPVAIAGKSGGAAVPVWVTVHAPADAAPGDYVGGLTIQAAGLPVTDVPVHLRIHGFRLPDPREFTPHVGLVQSPESVAMQYHVAMWSPRHWELLDHTFRLLGQVGNKTVYIPLLCRTHFGNDHSMVRWVKTPGGQYGHDFSIAEKYLDLAVKHLGRPPIVCLYVWDAKDATHANRGFPFTVLDPATGELTESEGPRWDDPAIVDFLKPVTDGLRQRLAQRGLGEAMMLGVSGDVRPPRQVAEVLKQVAPTARWVSQAHPRITDLYGIPAGYVTTVWDAGFPPDPQEQRLYGWQAGPFIYATVPREGSTCIGPLRPWASPVIPRCISEATLVSGLAGFGRVGADFWDVLVGAGGRRSPLVARFPEAAWAQLSIANATNYLLGPGPDGPVATIRFELLREGLQLAEARTFIERALTDPSKRARLGEDLARRCQQALDRRTYAIKRADPQGNLVAARGNPYMWAFASSGWLDRDDELYQLASEVVSALR